MHAQSNKVPAALHHETVHGKRGAQLAQLSKQLPCLVQFLVGKATKQQPHFRQRSDLHAERRQILACHETFNRVAWKTDKVDTR